MSRTLALGLVPALLVAALIGCGVQQAPPPPVAQNTENSRENEEKTKPDGDSPTDARGDRDARKKETESTPMKESLGDLKLNGTVGLGGSIPASGPAVGSGGPAPGAPLSLSTPAAIPAPLGATAQRFSVPAKPGGGLAGGRAAAAGRPGLADPKPANPIGGQGQLAAADGHDGANAERYGTYRENEFRSPLVAALSTFSADVNTASYSNVRRMLNQGSLPPRDAVFVAEFVNYFPYQYAAPKGEDPVEFNLEMGPCPWNRRHHLVRVGVQAFQIDKDKLPPRNLVFLIDTSGSMSSPNRLPLVKQAMSLLVDQLGEKDSVSIVTYAGDSRVALGPTKGSDKETIKNTITELHATGGTNGEGGIKNAYRLARETFIDGGVNRVILCTDGDFNIGQTSQGELVKMIEDYRRSKVFLTTLGFGMGNYKDEMLKELANHGNGHHAYIDTLDEAKKLFVDQGGALVCVAKDVKFQVDFNPAKVAAYRLIGYENRLLKDEDFKNDAKDAGDMGSGHQVTVLYEIIPLGVPVDIPMADRSKYTMPTKIDLIAPDEWLTVKMRYKHPEAEVSKELSKALPGPALGADLSDDFRFAASVAAFGMILRDSQYRGGMTAAGVVEEAQGCLKQDPGGHRAEFLELVKKTKEMTAPKVSAPVGGGDN